MNSSNGSVPRRSNLSTQVLGDRPLRLLKVDVEGMEVEVARGAREALVRYQPLVWAENVAYFESGSTAFLSVLNEVLRKSNFHEHVSGKTEISIDISKEDC